MSGVAGFFVDWDGNLRHTDAPGGGYLCDVDLAARYVGIVTKSGTLVHEATFFRDLDAVARAGIKARLVPGSQPWGERNGF
jgi:hypothetical protein